MQAIVLMIPVFLIAFFFVNEYTRFSFIVVYGIGPIIAATGAFIAYSFYNKVNSLQRGRYSYERWRHIWRIRFSQCPLMADETPAVFPEQS
jgi:hypothetical protein